MNRLVQIRDADGNVVYEGPQYDDVYGVDQVAAYEKLMRPTASPSREPPRNDISLT